MDEDVPKAQRLSRRSAITVIGVGGAAVAAGLTTTRLGEGGGQQPAGPSEASAQPVEAPRTASTAPGSRSGPGTRLWSDPATWQGRVPEAGEMVQIPGSVLLDVDVRAAGVVVPPGAELVFDPGASRTLTATGNVTVEGALRMEPGGPTVRHELVFAEVQELAFEGGGMEVIDADVGLWVMGEGQLAVRGAPKRGWVRAAAGVTAGSATIELAADATGWEVGDEIVLLPTARGVDKHYDTAVVTGIDGLRVQLDRDLEHDHPMMEITGHGTIGPEVVNMSRNVGIAGTPEGRSHVFIRSSRPQLISHLELKHLGPRLSDKREGEVLGRWPLHFHHCGDASRGSVVEGAVATATGSHAFVAHESHGVAFRDCVAYDVTESPFWWDKGDESHGTVYERCLAARVSSPYFSSGGFYLARGEDNTVTGCVAVDIAGSDSGGFVHPAAVEHGTWRAEDNLAHHTEMGWRTYFNGQNGDVVSRFVAYGCTEGIHHGAYGNSYRYEDCRVAGCARGIVLQADAKGDGIHFERCEVHATGADFAVWGHNGVSEPRSWTTFTRCTFRGFAKAAAGNLVEGDVAWWRFVDCDFGGMPALYNAPSVSDRSRHEVI